MRPTRGRLAVALAAALAAACHGPAAGSLNDADGVRALIAQRNADITRAYAAGDAGTVAAAFTQDAWQMPPHSPPLVGRAAIEGFWRQALTWGHWQFELQTQAVTVSGPLAIERGHYQLKFDAGPGAPPGMGSFADKGNYLVQWRREADGQWRAVADAPVSELPLPGAPAH